MAKKKYTDQFPKLVEEYLSEGMTDSEAAKMLGISHDTYYRYINEIPEFSDAVKRGKEDPNKEVKKSLFKRAIGYEYEEVHTEIRYTPQGEYKTIRKVKKQVIPDVLAQQVWLYNRDPQNWKRHPEFTDPTRPRTTDFDFEEI